ncbi:MAG: flavodoxin domain-containing protein [Candidatus Flexifilum sp.]|jgi:menaquinone-dependent protoporphyrinogen oxidase
MNDKPCLVAYASRYGSTAEIAARIGSTLSAHGLLVDVRPIGAPIAPAEYGSAVLGAPIYSAAWPVEMDAFVRTHQAALRPLPVALFAVALRLRDDSDALRAAVLGAIDVYRVMLAPVSIGLFAGALAYNRLSPIVRLQIQSKGLPEGDFRNWDAIARWAAGLPPLLAAR